MLKKTICDRKRVSREMIGNEKREREREKDKVASHSLFSPFLPLPTNRRRDYRERERERAKGEHSTHLNFSNYISCHARLQKVEWLQQPVSFSCHRP